MGIAVINMKFLLTHLGYDSLSRIIIIFIWRCCVKFDLSYRQISKLIFENVNCVLMLSPMRVEIIKMKHYDLNIINLNVRKNYHKINHRV